MRSAHNTSKEEVMWITEVLLRKNRIDASHKRGWRETKKTTDSMHEREEKREPT